MSSSIIIFIIRIIIIREIEIEEILNSSSLLSLFYIWIVYHCQHDHFHQDHPSFYHHHHFRHQHRLYQWERENGRNIGLLATLCCKAFSFFWQHIFLSSGIVSGYLHYFPLKYKMQLWNETIFIGPRSDHSLPSTHVTHSLTDSLTQDLVEDLMNWALLMESNI